MDPLERVKSEIVNQWNLPDPKGYYLGRSVLSDEQVQKLSEITADVARKLPPEKRVKFLEDLDHYFVYEADIDKVVPGINYFPLAGSQEKTIRTAVAKAIFNDAKQADRSSMKDAESALRRFQMFVLWSWRANVGPSYGDDRLVEAARKAAYELPSDQRVDFFNKIDAYLQKGDSRVEVGFLATPIKKRIFNAVRDVCGETLMVI